MASHNIEHRRDDNVREETHSRHQGTVSVHKLEVNGNEVDDNEERRNVGRRRHVQQDLVDTLEGTEQAESVGVRLARALIENGGATILDEIKEDRARRQGENKTAEEVAKIEAAQNPTA